jgi:hypothetical protein
MLILLDLLAEREGFEPPIALRLCLISSQVQNHKRPIFIGVLFCPSFDASWSVSLQSPFQNELGLLSDSQ